jgi:crotonobetainyl-CoA:carnitine CoA-transferase CaiB-like acyl-CoA transferase
MGREDPIDDPLFCMPALRVKNDDQLDPIIREWTMRHTKHEAMALVGGAGIPAGAVLDTMELQNDESFVARGVMQEMHHTSYKSLRMPAWPVRINGNMAKIEASPTLGQHTVEVLTGWLRMSPAEVEGLQGEGVLG